MSGMDRLTNEVLETLIDRLSRGYHAAWLLEDAEIAARELLAHRRASQAAPAPSDGTCAECGCAPVNADSLCATCVDERRAPAPSDGLREAVDAAWNDAIEAAASVYLNGSSPNTWDYFSLARHEIRALRRAAPTEDRCATCGGDCGQC